MGGLYDRSPNDYFSNQINLKANLNTNGSVNFYENLGETGVKIADYNAIIKNSAGYVQYSFNPINQIKVTLGSRFDQMDLSYTNNVGIVASGERKYSRLTNKIGLNFNIDTTIGFYSNFCSRLCQLFMEIRLYYLFICSFKDGDSINWCRLHFSVYFYKT